MWLKDGNPVSTAGTTGLQVSGVRGATHLSGASVGAGNRGQGLGTPGGEGNSGPLPGRLGPGRLAAGREESR